MSLVLLNKLEEEVKNIPVYGMNYAERSAQSIKKDVLKIIKEYKAEYRQKKRYCDCCGELLTEENNTCGFCICDKCNKELEEWHKKKYGGSLDER